MPGKRQPCGGAFLARGKRGKWLLALQIFRCDLVLGEPVPVIGCGVQLLPSLRTRLSGLPAIFPPPNDDLTHSAFASHQGRFGRNLHRDKSFQSA